MGLILNIETSTTVCAVSLAKDGSEILSKHIKSKKYSHSENLNLFIESIFNETNYSFNLLDAISVSKGPGSYTGLRIGVSTAKGLCYALDKPLLSVNSLKSLANLYKGEAEFIIPLFDARRMEVYSAVYQYNLTLIEDVKAVIVEENSYSNILAKGKTVFLGPGAEKCQSIIKNKHAMFDLNTDVNSTGMMSLSEEKLQNKQYDDVAYFEPFYLKEFIAGQPKKIF
jgi:tRNA threonylcarbamoyladenosine biosynthesis protein TsaB